MPGAGRQPPAAEAHRSACSCIDERSRLRLQACASGSQPHQPAPGVTTSRLLPPAPAGWWQQTSLDEGPSLQPAGQSQQRVTSEQQREGLPLLDVAPTSAAAHDPSADPARADAGILPRRRRNEGCGYCPRVSRFVSAKPVARGLLRRSERVPASGWCGERKTDIRGVLCSGQLAAMRPGDARHRLSRPNPAARRAMDGGLLAMNWRPPVIQPQPRRSQRPGAPAPRRPSRVGTVRPA
jgi:hypothetical protein